MSSKMVLRHGKVKAATSDSALNKAQRKLGSRGKTVSVKMIKKGTSRMNVYSVSYLSPRLKPSRSTKVIRHGNYEEIREK